MKNINKYIAKNNSKSNSLYITYHHITLERIFNFHVLQVMHYNRMMASRIFYNHNFHVTSAVDVVSGKLMKYEHVSKHCRLLAVDVCSHFQGTI